MADITRAQTLQNGISLNKDDTVGIFAGDQNPDTNAEIAPSGSVFINRTGPSVWQKQSDVNTDWIRFTNSIETAAISTVVTNNTTDISELSTTVSNLSLSGGAQYLDDLLDVDTSTLSARLGDTLKFNGTEWVPAGAIGLSGSANDYAFAYSETEQVTLSSATWQNITFDSAPLFKDFTPIGTPITGFISNVPSLFAATIDMNVKRSGQNNSAGVRATIDGVEIVGSANGITLTSNNTIFGISRTFLFTLEPGQVFSVQFSGTTAGSVIIAPALEAASADVNPSVTLTIRRLT